MHNTLHPVPGQLWQHSSGKVAKIVLLDVSGTKCKDGEIYKIYPGNIINTATGDVFINNAIIKAKACCDINPWEQCVIYLCCDELYARTVRNFLGENAEGNARFVFHGVKS